MLLDLAQDATKHLIRMLANADGQQQRARLGNTPTDELDECPRVNLEDLVIAAAEQYSGAERAVQSIDRVVGLRMYLLSWATEVSQERVLCVLVCGRPLTRVPMFSVCVAMTKILFVYAVSTNFVGTPQTTASWELARGVAISWQQQQQQQQQQLAAAAAFI